MPSDSFKLTPSQIDTLIHSLSARGYRVIGPTVRDHAIAFGDVASIDDLPRGITTQTSPATYRLREDGSGSLFHYWTGPDNLKTYLHPARVRLASAERANGAFHIVDQEVAGGAAADSAPLAFLGVRACDLAALNALDRVLLGDRYVDDLYSGRRKGLFLVAVNCTESAPTCFCESTGTGPFATTGFDIALTEIVTAADHWLIAQAGTAVGVEVLAELEGSKPDPSNVVCPPQSRSVDMQVAHDLIDSVFEHPRWEQTASRCLACCNCTQVCPTCFCVNAIDSSDVSTTRAERWRTWDSCFTQSFSYIHGGSVRLSTKSRYRQWWSHKLARWQDQFGMPGCVGCGRCITWCPVGIDITEEFAVLTGAAQ